MPLRRRPVFVLPLPGASTGTGVSSACCLPAADLAGESMLALSLAAPDSAQMHQLLAHEDTRQGNTNGAIAQYRKAIAIDPHLPGVHFELAELLQTSMDEAVKKEAEQEYQAALRENPQNEKSILRLAEIDAQKGNVEQSYKEYTKAVELQPADADAKLGLAKTLIEMNRADKALALLEETVKLEPTNATARTTAWRRSIGRWGAWTMRSARWNSTKI